MALKDKIEKIHALKNILDALMPMEPAREKKYWQKIRLDWNFNSNHIEGNTLTYGETKLLLMFDKTTGDHELREFEEMNAHDVAIHMVKEWAKDKTRDITEADIRELNRIILVKPYWKEAITPDGQATRRQIKVGEYKEYPNSVIQKNGEIFEYASPLETPLKMAELMEKYRNSTITEPIVEAAQLHYSFILIHPFDDGNGRVARLLVNYVLMKHDYPPIVIKSEDKANYLTALNKADSGDLVAFHEYMADQLIDSLNLAIKAAKGEEIEEPEDLDKKLAMLEMELQAIDPNDEVKRRLTKDVLSEILNSSIKNLLTKVIPVMRKFDKLFKESNHHVGITNGISHVDFKSLTSEKIIDLLIERFKRNNDPNFNMYNLELHISAFYITFIKGGLKAFNISSAIRIKFDPVKYQVCIDQLNEQGSLIENLYAEKLLHKNLNETEIDEIVKRFGDSIYNQIEFQMKKNGLR